MVLFLIEQSSLDILDSFPALIFFERFRIIPFPAMAENGHINSNVLVVQETLGDIFVCYN